MHRPTIRQTAAVATLALFAAAPLAACASDQVALLPAEAAGA